MSGDGVRRSGVAGLALALLALGLAGCISVGPSLDSYADARQAPGTVFEPQDTERPVLLKTLVPEDPTRGVDAGETNLYFLLYDDARDEPVQEAQVAIDVQKSPAGAGSSHVQAPTHVGEGIYHGVVTFDQAGSWTLGFETASPDGTVLAYELHVHAGVDPDHEH